MKKSKYADFQGIPIGVHCLVDGNGVSTALCDGLLERHTFCKMAFAIPQLPRTSWKELLIHSF